MRIHIRLHASSPLMFHQLYTEDEADTKEALDPELAQVSSASGNEYS